jgi:hypothetical protein
MQGIQPKTAWIVAFSLLLPKSHKRMQGNCFSGFGVASDIH